MEERADIRDVTNVCVNLLGKKLPNPASINEEVIVIAHDLTPSDTAQLDKNFSKSFAQPTLVNVQATQLSWRVRLKYSSIGYKQHH